VAVTESDGWGFMKSSRVSRVIRILVILQSGQHQAAADLAKMLGVSRRTVFRDLRDLRKAGVPCYYDKKIRSYTIDAKFFLPAPALSTPEALGLLLLVHKARSHIHLPFKDMALRAALKIQNNLPSEIKRYCNTALRNISIRANPQVWSNLLDKVFAQLVEASLKKRVVNIRYSLPRQQKSIVIDLSPYHLMCNDHSWYVLGRTGLRKRISAFSLKQIKELRILDKCFIEDKNFDIQEYLGRAWSMLPEGRLYNIKLRFLPDVASDVAQVQWHSTQTVTFKDDGSAIVEFRVDGLSEITWWVLGYGDKVQVLAPRILRQKIVKIAQHTIRQNEELLPI